jgi:hypothetical protein
MKSHLKHQTSKIVEQLKSHYYLHSGKFGLFLAHKQILGCKSSKILVKQHNLFVCFKGGMGTGFCPGSPLCLMDVSVLAVQLNSLINEYLSFSLSYFVTIHSLKNKNETLYSCLNGFLKCPFAIE